MDAKIAVLIPLVVLIFGGMIVFDRTTPFFDVCDLGDFSACKRAAPFTLFVNGNHSLQNLNTTARPEFDVNYVIYQQADGVVFRLPNLIRKDVSCEYVGKVRPFLRCNGTHGVFNGFRVETPAPRPLFNETGRLEAALVDADQTMAPRYTFFLALAYERAGELDKARSYYLQRASLGGWPPEHFYSQYRAGLLELAKENSTMGLLSAYALDPTRKEPLYYLARAARVKGDYPLCLLYSGAALQLSAPWTDALFVENDIYQWRVEDERALCLYYVGRKADARWHWNRLAGLVPEKTRARIIKNLNYV